MPRTLRLTIELSDLEDGLLSHAVTALKCTEEQAITGCIKFGLAKVQDNIPLERSMLDSLEGADLASEALRGRISAAVHGAEKALADSIALTRAVGAVMNAPSLVAEPETATAPNR